MNAKIPMHLTGLRAALALLAITSIAFAEDRVMPRARLTTIGINGSDPRVIYEGSGFEAPNWTPDGKWIVFNNGGALWRIAADGSTPPEKIATDDATGINNDHVLSPDCRTIYFSASGHLYAVPIGGGKPRRISNTHPPETAFKYFLHGVSPDDRTLAYVGVEAVGKNTWGRLDIFTIPTAGGPDTRLTDTPAPDDGPEFLPDGKWIYFNSELHAEVPGHAQCYRMKPDGHEQSDILAFRGGQGTINVNSWSPDSKRFAFVAYPVQPDAESK